ncbi:MAG: hypothetical protein HY923_04835 [Elusimicrobia bacterium]|nr:hypothetical protein [Elusimicrobiota bacterium]
MKKAFWSDSAQSAAVFAVVFLLNLCVRSLYFNFDGVACAIAVELGDFKHLVHGNHLGYGVLAWAFDRLWRLFGYQGHAVLTLQVLDSVLGAAGAAVFASLLRRLGRGEREAVLGAAALAVSHAWWFWSLEAQVYMLGALFMTLAAREALSDQPKPGWVGLWHALAVLGHVGHLMALPAFIYALTHKKGRREISPYLVFLSVVVCLAYVCAGLFAVKPSSILELKLWLLGSAALGVDRNFAWHGTSLLVALPHWLRMSLRVFTEFVGQTGLLWSAGVVLAVLPLLAGARAAADKSRESRFWLTWLAGYALLFLNWEPHTIVYRVTDLIALWALATLGLQSLSPRWRQAALASWTAAALAYNYAFVIKPASEFSNNRGLVEAEWTKVSSPPEAWVLVSNIGAVYVPYFAGRRTLNLRYYADEAVLRAKLDDLNKAGESVYVSGLTLQDPGLRAALERYGLKPVAETAGLSLFRVSRRK